MIPLPSLFLKFELDMIRLTITLAAGGRSTVIAFRESAGWHSQPGYRESARVAQGAPGQYCSRADEGNYDAPA